MKKISIIALTTLMCLFIPFSNVSAKEKTLDQLLAEAKANRNAYNKAKNQKSLTEQERKDAINQKAQVESEIKTINSQLNTIEKDITKIQKDIEVKDKEIKEIMKFVQVSNGESAYLEYAFGASSFTDFIYRVSVAEQLSNYNEELIESYNSDIKKLEQKQKELTVKQTELTKKEQELSILEAKLNKEIETLSEGMQSKEDEYKTQINMINNMKKLSCKGSETLSSCKSRIASTVKPSGGGSGNINVSNAYGTYMPISSGYLTSDYGQRTGEFHTGMDFASGRNDNVFPVAGGKVINIDYPAYSGACGNHKVYVLHNIKGVIYTTSYWHLTSVRVRVGQDVSATTKLGTIGGRGYTDACASGGHVHLNLFRGYTTNNSGRINPRIIIPQAPAQQKYFSHR